MRIYVVHHNDLSERREYLQKYFELFSLDVKWITKFHPDEIKVEYSEMCLNFEPNKERERIIQPYGSYKNKYKKISIKEYSLYLKHEYVLQKERNNSDIFLILEDDVEFIDNTDVFLNKNLHEFEESDCNLLVVGTAFNFRPENIIPGKSIHFESRQKTRCTHAIMYKPDCVPTILKHLRIVNNPYDFKLNEIIQIENLKVAWSEPGLKQKSFKSSLR